MPTTSLSIKYRPVKIGFLVRDGNIEDLVRAAEINTLLWGGVRNPIIPVSASNKDFFDQLVKLFSVDVFFAISHTPEIDKIISDNQFLKNPNHYAENIFYEDWDTKKNALGYLDSINIVNYYWEKEFKNKSKGYRSNCTLVEWDGNDPCNDLFSILFGRFPESFNLKDDFKNAFLKGLCSREVIIAQGGIIDKVISKSVNPLTATTLELSGYGGTWRGNGLYVGSGNNFSDLMSFWNLRASGLMLEFLPREHVDRFDEFIKAYLKRLDDYPNRNPNIEDWITVYYGGGHEVVKEVIKGFTVKKRFVLSHCDEVTWNGLNIKPADFYFNWQQVTASVEKNYDRYNVSVTLPNKKFLDPDQGRRDRNIDYQSLVVSIDPIGEFGYPEHTLKPPFIRELNEFYSREIEFDPWRVRSEQNGIGILIQAHDNSLSLYPIAHYKLMEKIFELAGYRADMSQAGLLAKQIVRGMREDNPLEACRVFKITGARKLISSLKADEDVEWKKAIKTIGENSFDKFKKLYIESRETPELTPIDVFSFLLKKKVFSPKIRIRYKMLRSKWKFKCINCGLEEKILVKDFESFWDCPYCGYKHYMPSYIAESFKRNQNIYWNFKKSGLFAKDNNQEGAVPVIVSLLTFARIFNNNKLIYSTSLNLQNSKKCEIDFCVLQHDRGDKIQLGIAECKSEGQEVNQQDVNNLKRVQDDINKVGIDCYIIFSKTADNYEASEIELFRTLKNEGRKFVILSNKELEPYHPYWEMEKTDKLPEKYALDLMGMYRNSLFLYLN
ncbi:MAG: hypothetical protein PHE24_01190 [Patescibacteria group bacterium]|nr:hypothetical protein [Patescibacteria group bacterium]